MVYGYYLRQRTRYRDRPRLSCLSVCAQDVSESWEIWTKYYGGIGLRQKKSVLGTDRPTDRGFFLFYFLNCEKHFSTSPTVAEFEIWVSFLMTIDNKTLL